MKKREIKLPHTMAIFFACIVLAAVLSHIIPAGEYARVVNDAGITVIDPNGYATVESAPASFFDTFRSITLGFMDVGSLVAFTLIAGGAIMVLRKTGVIDAAIGALAMKVADKKIIVIPIFMTLFAVIDNFIGTPELDVVYIAILLPLMYKLGFDSLTCVGMVMLGSAAGFSAAITNPFTVVIGQKISELPLYSGWQFRICTFAVTLTIGILYVMRYGKRVLKDPTCSSVYNLDLEKKATYLNDYQEVHFDMRKKLSGLFAIAIFGWMMYGIIVKKWDMPEMAAAFIIMGIGCGIISRLSIQEICDAFCDGCKDMLMGALFIALARATYVILSSTKIVDTIIYFLAGLLTSLPAQLTVIGVFLVVTVLNFFIMSGSGKAVLLFPILAPLADICGITRQTAVLAYQFGDGFTNMFYPTSALVGACLGLVGIPYTKWAKFYLPLLGLWTVSSVTFLLIAQAISYGPF